MNAKMTEIHNELITKDGIFYAENGLYCSSNYDFAILYKGNRYVVGANFNPEFIAQQELVDANKRVNRIKEMFLKYAEEKQCGTLYLFDMNIPVIIAKINDKYVIVDGQNRVAACRDLNIPYFFRVLVGIETEEELLSYIKRLNYTKTAWTKSQQIGSDARLGNPYAKFIIDLEREYKIPISNIMYFTMGKSSHKLRIDFTTTEFDTDRALMIAKLIVRVSTACTYNEKESLTLRKDNRFTNFVTYIFEKNLSHILMQKAQENKVTKIKGACGIETYIIAFDMKKEFRRRNMIG